MQEAKKTTYRLYALPLKAESIDAAANERFVRATPTPSPGYVLVYTSGERTDGAEIEKDDLHRLTARDMSWLNDCNFIILAEDAKNREADIAKSLESRLDAFEKALKAEKDKQTEGG